MHPWKPWIVLACLATFAGQAAVVYKWTDSDGVIHYSDQPVPGAEKIFTASSPSPGGSGSSAGTANPSGLGGKASASKKSVAPGLEYNQFAITSPLPDQTFFGDDVISAHLALEPGLKPNQTITWRLNGGQLENPDPTATQLTLPHLERGTYTLAATVTDQTTGESASTDSVSFFVHQPSLLSPQHQKP
jgi:hypothetical protein